MNLLFWYLNLCGILVNESIVTQLKMQNMHKNLVEDLHTRKYSLGSIGPYVWLHSAPDDLIPDIYIYIYIYIYVCVCVCVCVCVVWSVWYMVTHWLERTPEVYPL